MPAFDNLTARARPEHAADVHSCWSGCPYPACVAARESARRDRLVDLTTRLREAEADYQRASEVVDECPTAEALFQASHGLDAAMEKLDRVHVQHSLAMAEMLLAGVLL